ncbi:hypothetical protein NDU88_003239 [Pleurodeles waltl]|uniref:Uncharacterized protein n=1 Tax=Pleurodeles waltl TaxID=8319 RepID=A0AAV7QCE2_PLEWA|nr:hypothetical protein NDU88_003239 [Pleurodeles waltl]
MRSCYQRKAAFESGERVVWRVQHRLKRTYRPTERPVHADVKQDTLRQETCFHRQERRVEETPCFRRSGRHVTRKRDKSTPLNTLNTNLGAWRSSIREDTPG